MKRALLLSLAVLSAGSGFALHWTRSQEALDARRLLTSELSTTLGRARQLDAIRQQWAADRAQAPTTQALIKDAVTRAKSPEERKGYEAALACVTDPGCTQDRQALLTPLEDEYAQALAPAWGQADAAEKQEKDSLWISLLLLLGLPVIALGALATGAPKAPAATAEQPKVLPSDIQL